MSRLPFDFCMTARDELIRDIDVTDRLLKYTGYSRDLRKRLLDQREAMVRELAALDASGEPKKPPQRGKVIEFPGNAKIPKKAG